MFERKESPITRQITPAQSKICLFSDDGQPVEFVYNGIRFHINQTLTTWLQTNSWWEKIEAQGVNEAVNKYWQVEAAPIGALTTFEIEFNQVDNSWQIRPTSKVKSNE